MTVTLFDKDLRVYGSPSRYIQAQGAIGQVGRLVRDLGHRAIVVSDKLVLELIGDQLTACLAACDAAFEVVEFNGDLLLDTASQLKDVYVPTAGDVIVACGGGRAIDTGKALAEIVRAPLITVPTVASNDAPTSKNFVLYDTSHRLVEVRHLSRNPDAVIVDTQILAGAPKHMFAAGLGDALAKFSEAQACATAGGVNMFNATPPRIALAIAQCCEDTLLAHGASAFDVAGTRVVTEAFDASVEAMILMAGLGFENGGLSIAHALTRGLSLIPGAKDAPHGFQVAYGLCVQHMVAETPVPEVKLNLMRHAGLPVTLAELCGRPISQHDYEVVAQATSNVRHLKNFPAEVSARQLIDAMHSTETPFSKTPENELG